MNEDEIKTLLRRNLELSKENNRLLRKAHRSDVLNRFIQLLVAAFIIGVPIYLYYNFLQPIFADLGEAYQTIESGAQEFQDKVSNVPVIGDFLGGPKSE